MKGKSRRERIASMSNAERESLEREVRESNARYRSSSLEDVVDAALAYYAEEERRDPAHKARMSQRKEALRSAIKYAYEAMHPGPITDLDLAFAASFRNKEHDTET